MKRKKMKKVLKEQRMLLKVPEVLEKLKLKVMHLQRLK
jgi:hypothetical protein